MNSYKILCEIGESIIFIIGGKFHQVEFNDLNKEDNLNRIYRIQFKRPPKSDILDLALLAIQKRPEISLRFYGDYSEDLIDWDRLCEIQNIHVDLWNTISLEGISKLKNLKLLSVTQNVSSKVSLSILEPLQNLEVLYSNISKDIETVGELKKLKKISFHEIKSDNLDFLTSLYSLSTLSLSLGSFKNFDGLQNINTLEKLHIIQVRGFNDDTANNVLANCSRIWALKLDLLKYITRLNFVKWMSGLKYLSFEGVQNLETYYPILENKSLESLTGYNCRPNDKSLLGLKNLKNIRLGDSYSKSEINEFLGMSEAKNITIRGKLLKGNAQTETPFYPY